MKISDIQTDLAVLKEIGDRLTKIRLNQNLTQEELAREAGLSKRTIERLETGKSIQLSNFVRAIKALRLTESLDRIFPERAPSPIEQLKLGRIERQRASQIKSPQKAYKRWTWADKK